MKRTLALIALTATLAITAFAQTPVAAKATGCSNCCHDTCGQNCCPDGCTGSCCQGK